MSWNGDIYLSNIFSNFDFTLVKNRDILRSQRFKISYIAVRGSKKNCFVIASSSSAELKKKLHYENSRLARVYLQNCAFFPALFGLKFLIEAFPRSESRQNTGL